MPRTTSTHIYSLSASIFKRGSGLQELPLWFEVTGVRNVSTLMSLFAGHKDWRYIADTFTGNASKFYEQIIERAPERLPNYHTHHGVFLLPTVYVRYFAFLGWEKTFQVLQGPFHPHEPTSSIWPGTGTRYTLVTTRWFTRIKSKRIKSPSPSFVYQSIIDSFICSLLPSFGLQSIIPSKVLPNHSPPTQ